MSQTTSAQVRAGLSGTEAARRLKVEGYNEGPTRTNRSVTRIVFEVMHEPMFLLLLGAGLIYLILGDRADALMLLGFVVMTIGITVFQERKTERVLESLRALASPRALVLRDGEQLRIPGREVVRGDLLVLEEGDRVAADGVLLEANDLLIDELLLTGESIAVTKTASCASGPSAEYVDDNRVHAGALILQGGGLAQVTATGALSAVGQIGALLQTLRAEPSPLTREIGSLVKRFAMLGAAISVLVVLLYLWTRGQWLEGLLAGITLAMSILPEEFTVVFTVFMALGAWRISRSGVLTRHTPAIETLGSTTVLCVDKTGTLTENRMSVRAIAIDHETFSIDIASGINPNEAGRAVDPLPETVRTVLEAALLASEPRPFDPMDKAIHRSMTQLYPQVVAGREDWELVHEHGLAPACLAMTHVWQAPDAEAYVVATKGAPEAVARLCQFDADKMTDMMQQVEALATQGMRVLAVAQAIHRGASWPATPDGYAFSWLGLIGLADPLRPQVADAVRECHAAGIRVVMITGDHPATARAIATQAGLPAQDWLSGAQLKTLGDDAIQDAVRHVQVFARILPEQKLRLVNALKANGEVVAMTGDGVNDAPALRAAHIGISMGRRGTDVAREASSLVLMNDDFASLVEAIRLGRRIYANLRKALVYIVAVHLPIAGMTLLPLLAGTPLAFAPIHIVFLEMIINPTCAIVFEAERAEADIMRQPPRHIGERLFGLRNVSLAVLQGVGLLSAVALVFFGSLDHGLPEAGARALAFSCLVIGGLGLIISSRSGTRHVLDLVRISNRAQWLILAGTGMALAATLYLPALRTAFRFSEPDPLHLVAAILIGLSTIIWFELMKVAFRKIRHAATS